MSQESYLVIAAKGYDFTNDDRERVTGLNVFYLDPIMREDTDSQVGLIPLKVPALTRLASAFSPANVPGFYELSFRQRPDAKGKPVLTLADAKFLGKAALTLVEDKVNGNK